MQIYIQLLYDQQILMRGSPCKSTSNCVYYLQVFDEMLPYPTKQSHVKINRKKDCIFLKKELHIYILEHILIYIFTFFFVSLSQ